MENRVLQIAKADSVVNGVYCLTITQNVIASLDDCGATEQIYCRNSIELLLFFYTAVIVE